MRGTHLVARPSRLFAIARAVLRLDAIHLGYVFANGIKLSVRAVLFSQQPTFGSSTLQHIVQIVHRRSRRLHTWDGRCFFVAMFVWQRLVILFTRLESLLLTLIDVVVFARSFPLSFSIFNDDIRN